MNQNPQNNPRSTSRASLRRPVRMSMAAVAMLLAVIAATIAPASATDDRPGPKAPVEFSLQNYFNAGGTLIPFFEPQTGTIGRGVEVSGDYIYSFNFNRRSIKMRWSSDPAFDIYEPYVGRAGGFSQEEAAAAPIADEYHFTFSQPISQYRLVVDPKWPLQPNVTIVDDHTVVISVPGGTTIGDGVDAKIWILPRKAH